MVWAIEFDPAAARQFKKLDGSVQRQILKYLKKVESDPLSCGYWLEENLAGLRKYRIGDWRVASTIDHSALCASKNYFNGNKRKARSNK